MFKKLEKKKPYSPIIEPESVPEIVTCGACGYERKPADHSPHWQCPGCGVAYDKVNKKQERQSLSQQERRELRRKNHAYLEKKKLQENEPISAEQAKLRPAQLGSLAGLFTFMTGLGSTCSGAAANPFMKAVGAIIIIGAALYMLVKLVT